jgi:hypothetical protein
VALYGSKGSSSSGSWLARRCGKERLRNGFEAVDARRRASLWQHRPFLCTALALSAIFIKPNVWFPVFLAVSIFLILVLPRLAPWFFGRYGDRVIEPEIKLVFLCIFVLMVLADASNGHAVLPAFVLGLVMSRHYQEHREEQKRLRVVERSQLARPPPCRGSARRGPRRGCRSGARTRCPRGYSCTTIVCRVRLGGGPGTAKWYSPASTSRRSPCTDDPSLGDDAAARALSLDDEGQSRLREARRCESHEVVAAADRSQWLVAG